MRLKPKHTNRHSLAPPHTSYLIPHTSRPTCGHSPGRPERGRCRAPGPRRRRPPGRAGRRRRPMPAPWSPGAGWAVMPPIRQVCSRASRSASQGGRCRRGWASAAASRASTSAARPDSITVAGSPCSSPGAARPVVAQRFFRRGRRGGAGVEVPAQAAEARPPPPIDHNRLEVAGAGIAAPHHMAGCFAAAAPAPAHSRPGCRSPARPPPGALPHHPAERGQPGPIGPEVAGQRGDRPGGLVSVMPGPTSVRLSVHAAPGATSPARLRARATAFGCPTWSVWKNCRTGLAMPTSSPSTSTRSRTAPLATSSRATRLPRLPQPTTSAECGVRSAECGTAPLACRACLVPRPSSLVPPAPRQAASGGGEVHIMDRPGPGRAAQDRGGAPLVPEQAVEVGSGVRAAMRQQRLRQQRGHAVGLGPGRARRRHPAAVWPGRGGPGGPARPAGRASRARARRRRAARPGRPPPGPPRRNGRPAAPERPAAGPGPPAVSQRRGIAAAQQQIGRRRLEFGGQRGKRRLGQRRALGERPSRLPRRCAAASRRPAPARPSPTAAPPPRTSGCAGRERRIVGDPPAHGAAARPAARPRPPPPPPRPRRSAPAAAPRPAPAQSARNTLACKSPLAVCIMPPARFLPVICDTLYALQRLFTRRDGGAGPAARRAVAAAGAVAPGTPGAAPPGGSPPRRGARRTHTSRDAAAAPSPPPRRLQRGHLPRPPALPRARGPSRPGQHLPHPPIGVAHHPHRPQRRQRASRPQRIRLDRPGRGLGVRGWGLVILECGFRILEGDAARCPLPVTF